MYNRREILLGMGGMLGLGLGSVRANPQSTIMSPQTPVWGRNPQAAGPSRLGVCTDSYWLRNRASRNSDEGSFAEPLKFLAYCHDLGAGGVQMPVGKRDDAYTAKLARQAKEWGMFVEATGRLPKDQADVERFEADVTAAVNAGVRVIRVVLPSKGSGRRYEAYKSSEEFLQTRDRGRGMLEIAEPVVARHRVRLAVENHKDERIPEKLETIKALSSEYVGVCVDTGNDIAFLEDPMAVVEAYAPYAFSVHLKDMDVREYEDGFLLAEVPLGEGILDLPKVVQTLRRRHPEVNFSLEMMTRDPLKVPCLTEAYWAAMGDIPGSSLARTLKLARTRGGKPPLPQVSQLPASEQLALEDANVKKCLAYAKEHLGL
ncbi:MAG: sugar phosphate isomerase/epimerase [Sedimentisphaerales bacterium]|nr:sugar phosphate isomerase/epimerase [Sedimentisphaerales bacterium]